MDNMLPYMELLQQRVFFSQKLDTPLSETTVRSIRDAYGKEKSEESQVKMMT